MSTVQEQGPPNEHTRLLATLEQEEDEETMSSAIFWKIGALYGATAVGLGAFGAHGLKRHISDPQRVANWSTAAQYQLIHAVALLVARSNPVASTLFTAGMTMFSGSIYALVLDPDRFKPLGPVTPLGGLCLIAGWLALGFTRGGSRRWPRF
ncbi:hypothetical protein QBC46DRAFT_399529 [Diplogelasinospora grovesii]|uniref:Uncharacterized protein n=1 Tax=Diplogelasinospora grovesii TaxID=303347 RepID=A0AAN6RYG0_9PEZI|nr:hypothetical protein QBC46DRAFT_399529 [Diplogelasinospora grovesii]